MGRGGEHNTMLKACIVPLTAYCMVGEKAVRPQHTGEKKVNPLYTPYGILVKQRCL
jgi:hypothetical protein